MQQGELHHAPPTDRGNRLAFPSAEVEVIFLDVAVASLNFLKQATLGMLPVTKDFVGTDIVGEDGKKQRVFAVFAEESAETGEVGSKKRVGLSDSEVSGEPLALMRLDAVPPTDVGVVFADVVPSLVVLDDAHRSLEGRQAHDGVLRPNMERRERQ